MRKMSRIKQTITIILVLLLNLNCGPLKWVTKAPMQINRIRLSASWGVDPNGKLRIYAIGGTDQSTAYNSVEGYDIENNTWQNFHVMNTYRAYHASVTYYSGMAKMSKSQVKKITPGALKIYVFGGLYGNVELQSVEEYDTQTDTWTYKADMSTKRGTLAAAAGNNGKIYVFGGENNYQLNVLNLVEEYDPATNTWTTKAPMPAHSWGLAAATGSDGRIYVTGGTNGHTDYDNLWIYDPATNTWTTGLSMPGAVSGHSSAAVESKIYVLSGQSAWVYDIANPSQGWIDVPQMTCGFRIDAAATSFLGDLYLLGGYKKFDPPLNCNEIYTMKGD